MDNDKIRINGKDFYVIPQCQKEDHTLCVAAESWGESTWGEGTNGQRILDAADNRNPKSLTHAWYESLPEDTKKAILTVSVTTDDYNEAGEGVLEQTEMFVPSYEEWRKIPREVREMIAKDDCLWSRSYYGTVYDSYGAWFVISGGNVFGNFSQYCSFVVAPAFYISDNLLESLIRKSDNEVADKRADKEDMPPVIFTIWPNHRITTGNIQFRYLNTACCTDICTLYESMKEISKEVKKKCGRDVLFEVSEF